MNILKDIKEYFVKKKVYWIQCSKCKKIIKGTSIEQIIWNYDLHFKNCSNTDDLKVVKEEIENENQNL